MAFTMHSHSGQFCPSHAKDDLEAILQQAIAVGMRTIGMTEHMPRAALSDLYPDDMTEGITGPEEALAVHKPRHEAYIAEATRLRDAYADQIRVVIGFEGEWIRPEYASLVRALTAHPDVDYFIGSLHHARGVPVEYDPETFARACRVSLEESYLIPPPPPLPPSSSSSSSQPPTMTSGEKEGLGSGESNVDIQADAQADRAERALYNAYFADQADLLASLRPPIVGHFDVVRLLSRAPDRDLSLWPDVWARVLANLRFASEAKLLLECNSSALRKGLTDPYPSRQIAKEWIALGGRFTLSDDSHGVAQVATNYGRAIDFLEGLGVVDVWVLERRGAGGERVEVVETRVPLTEVRKSLRLT